MRTTAWEVLLIAVSGSAGALARFGVGLIVATFWSSPFPLGTLVVNVVGCFLMGLVMHLGISSQLSPLTVATIAVGFLGALTTFSAFSWQTLDLLQTGHVNLAFANIAANFALNFLAVWAGLALGRAVA